MRSDPLGPVHPGEVLREEFMSPLGLSAAALARAAGLPAHRVADLAGERAALRADTALRLARVLDTSPEFWMNLQTRYDLDHAERQMGDAVARLRPVAAE
jgi:addiction module HigA family antidote